MEKAVRIHDYLFKEIGDPRVYNWPFMSSPWKILGILVVYLSSIYVFLPFYMSKREPFKLKTLIAVYNVFQIVFNLMVLYGVVTSGWTTHYKFFCQLVDYSEDKMALRMASYLWWFFILKIIDLTDTILFVLRKKYNQVSTFHVYHHSSTVVLMWILVKYIAGGMTSFGMLLNAFVHVLMYTYYLLSSLGPEMQNKLNRVKSKLTMLQMIQIIVVTIYCLLSLLPSCEFPIILACVIVPDTMIIFYFFLNFYIKSYVKRKNTKAF